MLQSFKRFWLALVILLGGGTSVFGFALLGPGTPFPSHTEAYQAPVIGYMLPVVSALGDAFPADVGTPKNIAQGYRWNTPTVYYAFDASFITYFGSNGLAAVDQAFAMYNNLPAASDVDLSTFPYDSSRVNFAAQALGLLDLKSETMSLMIEQLGLAPPDRFTWALHDRDTANLTCPNFDYIVIQRNYDPVTQIYSPYVNNTLYGYTIVELCGLTPNTFAPLLADAEEYTTDPTTALSAVASQAGEAGRFFTGFTRDDIGGLRYLYSKNNIYAESAESNSLQVVVSPQLSILTTSNLAIFEQQALTSDAVTLSLLYPGLIITSTTNFFTNVITTNFSFFLTNVIGAAAGTVTIGTAITLTTNIQSLFVHTFANLVILHTGGLATETIQQTSVTAQKVSGGVAGTVTVSTNVISSVITTPFTNGDFYILPPNLCGKYVNPDGSSPLLPDGTPGELTTVQLAQLVSVTNPIPIIVGTFGPVPQFFIANIVQTFTNFSYLVREVDCGTNTTALRQGMEKINFVRRDFDALLGTTWDPITNTYTLTAFTNAPILQTFRRIVTQPDILFTTGDLTAGPSAPAAISAINRTIPNWNVSQVPAGQAGPGTIQPGVVLTYNNVGPVFLNEGPYFRSIAGMPGFDGTTQPTNALAQFQWGSFDGTTNAPVVYPSSLSLSNLLNVISFQITTTSPLAPSLTVNTPVSIPFAASGATQPYSWIPNPPGLPKGLSFSAAGVLSGTPRVVGTNDVIVQVMDAGQRVTSKIFNIPVTP